jgi:hypothetical protein
VAVLGLVLWAPVALAQSSGSDSSSSSSADAGGSSTSGGSNSSSVSIHTSGGSSVGVAQGSVAAGSRSSGSNNDGDQTGSASSGDSSSGQVTGVSAPAANAVEDGIVSQVDLPALGNLGSTQTAADRRPDVLTLAIAAVIVVGLIVLYRRIPRSTPAA